MSEQQKISKPRPQGRGANPKMVTRYSVKNMPTKWSKKAK